MIRLVPLFLLLALVTWPVTSFDVTTQKAIDDVVEAGMKCKRHPALAMAVVKDGKVVSSKGYGVKDMLTKQAVTSDTLFQIASLTKAFTAALLSNIISENTHLKVSSTLHSTHTLPDDFRFNNTLRTTYATLEDLLAHRTGVPRNSLLRLNANYSIDTIASKLAYLPSVGGFRDSFYYNDIMYGLAAYITEKLGSSPWQTQVREKIFHPLGMTRSTFISDVDFDNDDVATPYVLESGALNKPSRDFIKHWGQNTGSGSIFSSANDMAQWMLMLLNDGKDGHGTRVLRDGVVSPATVFHPSNPIPPSSNAANFRRPVVPYSFSADTYAYGWKLGHYRGYQMIYHSGSTFGYRAFLTLLPELNVGVVSLMTGSDIEFKFRTALHENVMDRVLGYTPWINSSSICTFPEPWKSAYGSSHSSDEESVSEEEEEDFLNINEESMHASRDSRASLDLQLYAGVFQHGAYGDLAVHYNASTQSLLLDYGVGQWQLASTDGRQFIGHWTKGSPTIHANFLFHSHNQHTVSVEASSFDKSKPPIFFRRQDSTSGPLVG